MAGVHFVMQSATATSADTLHKEVMSVKARADAAEAGNLLD